MTKHCTVTSDKTIEQAASDLDATVWRHEFGVPHIHDPGNTTIVNIQPVAVMLAALSREAAQFNVEYEVEAKTRQMIDEAT